MFLSSLFLPLLAADWSSGIPADGRRVHPGPRLRQGQVAVDAKTQIQYSDDTDPPPRDSFAARDKATRGRSLNTASNAWPHEVEGC